MSNLAETLERFRRGPELLAVVLTGVYGDETDFTPSPGKWSIRQIIAHLADAELVAAQRFRQVIAEDNPTLEAFDQDAWARNLGYARRQPKQALESFRRLRSDNYELLKELPEAAFERTGIHSERGPQTLRHLLETSPTMPKATRGRCRRFARNTKSKRGRSDETALAGCRGFACLLYGADPSADGKRWWSHILYLADDKLEGRNTGSEGYRKAAIYVAGRVRASGSQAGRDVRLFSAGEIQVARNRGRGIQPGARSQRRRSSRCGSARTPPSACA